MGGGGVTQRRGDGGAALEPTPEAQRVSIVARNLILAHTHPPAEKKRDRR